MLYYYEHWEEGTRSFPYYSNPTFDEVREFYDYTEKHQYNTVDEINQDLLKAAKMNRSATVAKHELRDIIRVFEKEQDNIGYYDNNLVLENRFVYEKALNAYSGDNDEEVHVAYITACNHLNQLALYNTVYGDINHDGSFNIADVTELQKVIAHMRPQLNFSQLTVIYDGTYSTADALCPNINKVTSLQKVLAQLQDIPKGYKNNIDTIIKSGGKSQYEPYPDDRRIFSDDYMANGILYHYICSFTEC